MTTNPIWDFFTETFDLLSSGQFENLVRRGGFGFYLFPKNGTKILVPRSWYHDLGTKILVPRSWYQDPGTKILVPRSSYQDPGTKIFGGTGPWVMGGIALSTARNRYPFFTVRTPQAGLVGEKDVAIWKGEPTENNTLFNSLQRCSKQQLQAVLVNRR